LQKQLNVVAIGLWNRNSNFRLRFEFQLQASKVFWLRLQHLKVSAPAPNKWRRSERIFRNKALLHHNHKFAAIMSASSLNTIRDFAIFGNIQLPAQKIS